MHVVGPVTLFAALGLGAIVGCRRNAGAPAEPTVASVSSAVVTPQPKPTAPWHGKHLHVWTTSCDARSEEVRSVLATVDAHAPPRPSVGIACQTLAPDGALATIADPAEKPDRNALVAKLHALGVETSIVVANTGPNGFDGALGARVLHDETTRDRLVDALLVARANERHAAIEVDLEAMPTSARGDLVTLVRILRAKAPADVRIEVDVHPKTTDDPGWDGPGAHDYRSLADAGAIVRLMTYDLSIGPVPPGPSTKASWVRDVVKYARDVGVPPSQLEIGLPAYGYDFPPQGKGPAVALRYKDVMDLAKRLKSQWIRDPEDVPHFVYDGKDGKHEVWADDATSLSRVLRDLSTLTGDVRGVAIWGVGDCDPNLPSALAEQGL